MCLQGNTETSFSMIFVIILLAVLLILVFSLCVWLTKKLEEENSSKSAKEFNRRPDGKDVK